MTAQEEKIVNAMALRKGVYGMVAKNCLTGKVDACELIMELFDYCHMPQVKKDWGEDIVNEIVEYGKMKGKAFRGFMTEEQLELYYMSMIAAANINPN